MRVTAFTWNMHGGTTLPELETDADLHIISLQESSGWVFPKIRDRHIRICSMFGLRTIVGSRDPLKVEFFRMGLGPLGFINKGFIVASINDHIIHVNAHLAPHDHNMHLRLQQLDRILKFIRRDAQVIILTGDLNFRCTPDDQGAEFLRMHLSFKEGAIRFKPTYKYVADRYDTSQVPSYCDRVLVASIFRVRFLLYTSLDDVFLSDHKPVLCKFEITDYNERDRVLAGTRELFRMRRLITEIYVGVVDHGWGFRVGMTLFILLVVSKAYLVEFLLS